MMTRLSGLLRHCRSNQNSGGNEMDTIFRTLALLVALIIPMVLVSLALDIRRQSIQDHALPGISISDIDRQVECMTRNIYYEASHEPAEGKIAVAQVVMNRVASSNFPNDPCQVINQKTVFHSRVVCQFTWLCDGSVNRRAINPALWDESRQAAKKVLLEGFRLPSLENALFYHADYVNPRWRLDEVARIGRHIFYKPQERSI
jgi:spore germination cell wall hydrolase CwlJ-like protein